MLCQASNNQEVATKFLVIGKGRCQRWKCCVRMCSIADPRRSQLLTKAMEWRTSLQILFFFFPIILHFSLSLSHSNFEECGSSLLPLSYVFWHSSVLQCPQEMGLWGLDWQEVNLLVESLHSLFSEQLPPGPPTQIRAHAFPAPENGAHSHSVSFGPMVQNHSRY